MPGASRWAINTCRFGAVTSVPGFAVWSWPTKVTFELSAAPDTSAARSSSAAAASIFFIFGFPQVVPETIQQSRRMHTVARGACASLELSRTIAAHADFPAPEPALGAARRPHPGRVHAPALAEAPAPDSPCARRPVPVRVPLAVVLARALGRRRVAARLANRAWRLDARARPVCS